MNAPHPKPGLAEPDPLTAALRAILGPLVRDAVTEAVGELRDGEPMRPAVLTGAQLCAALQISKATLHRLKRESLPCLYVCDSPRYQLEAVLAWLHERTARKAG